MYNLPVRLMGIYGYRDIGLILMTDIFGCRAYGFSHHNPDSYGHPLIGDIPEVIMVFIQGTGDLMSVFMAA
jgi:hypothetical protein